MLVFPNAKIGIENIIAYAYELSDINEAELIAGVRKSKKVCRFFPSIAEILENSHDMVEVVTETRVKNSDEAWNEVLHQMKEAFIYKKPTFSTPEIETAALSMGWVGMCETETDNIGTIRAQFTRMYESVCKRKKETRVNNDVLNSMGAKAVNSLIDSTVKQIGDVK